MTRTPGCLSHWTWHFRVRGRSMLPTLEEGDLVGVLPAQGCLPELDSLVVVTDPADSERMLVKRVVSAGRASFSVRSDNPLEGRDSRHFGSLGAADLVGTVAWISSVR